MRALSTLIAIDVGKFGAGKQRSKCLRILVVCRNAQGHGGAAVFLSCDLMRACNKVVLILSKHF
jgi:hypothetical protein